MGTLQELSAAARVEAGVAEKSRNFVVAFFGRWTAEEWRAFVGRQEKRWGPLDEALIRRRVEATRARFLEGHARLFFCRGCCCGNPERSKGTDHDLLLARFASESARLGLAIPWEVTGCQGPCADRNVATLRIGAAWRRFLGLNDPAAVTAMAEEIRMISRGYTRARGPREIIEKSYGQKHL